MKQILVALTISAIVALAGCTPTAPIRSDSSLATIESGEQRCSALAGLQLGFATVDKTEYVVRGEQLISLVTRMLLRVAVPDLPSVYAPRDFCRVSAELRPAPDSLVKAQAWLPTEWNGKVFAAGGGGFNGGLFAAPLTLHQASEKGYATVASDVGHDTTESARFAHDHPEQFIDYGYRGEHVTAVFIKDLVAAYYGKSAKHSYFQGGSNGGREALMEARRFPEDYDGIIAGQPATSWSKLMASFAWNRQAVNGAPQLKNKLKLVYEAVLKKCDALDGVKDGLIENPLKCTFDPAGLQCKGSDAADCLNPDEVVALHNIYGGPRMGNGQQVFPGMPVGGEGLPNNWDTWIIPEHKGQGLFAEEAFRWMVHGDPTWTFSQFDFTRDYQLAKDRMGPIMDSDDPDLTAFLGRGGKLILDHGWSDAAIPAESTIDYYNAVRRKVGEAANRQVRLFMVPGMRHSPGGPAPTSFDMLDELDRWVEGGPAPERVVATQYEPASDFGTIDPSAKPVRTRPLCAWPKQAHYAGTGSIDEQANFTCSNNPDQAGLN